MPRWFEGGAFATECNGILFSVFERAPRAYVCLTEIEGGALSSKYGVDSVWRFDGFITFVVNLYCIWRHYYICSQFLLPLRAILLLWSIITFVASSKGYRPEARGYVIYSPRAFRGQRTRGINHITTSWRPIKGLFLHWRGFLKGCKNTLTKNASIVHLSFVF